MSRRKTLYERNCSQNFAAMPLFGHLFTLVLRSNQTIISQFCALLKTFCHSFDNQPYFGNSLFQHILQINHTTPLPRPFQRKLLRPLLRLLPKPLPRPFLRLFLRQLPRPLTRVCVAHLFKSLLLIVLFVLVFPVLKVNPAICL